MLEVQDFAIQETVVFVGAAIFFCLLVDVNSSPVISDPVDDLHSGNLHKYTHPRNRLSSGFERHGIPNHNYWVNQHKKLHLPANYYGPSFYRKDLPHDYAD